MRQEMCPLACDPCLSGIITVLRVMLEFEIFGHALRLYLDTATVPVATLDETMLLLQIERDIAIHPCRKLSGPSVATSNC